MSDGGAGGGSATEGEGTHSPSRRKKKRLDEDMPSKKDTLDQVCNKSLLYGCGIIKLMSIQI